MQDANTATAGASPTTTLLLYAYLQVLDVISTLAFLLTGLEEANPVVRWAIEWAPNPVTALIVVKVSAALLGLFCWRTGRIRLLGRINLFFSLLIIWNLVALVMKLATL